MYLPYLADRSELTHATDLITVFGGDAGQEAAARANRSRDLGNYLHFCRWRQIERLIALVGSSAAAYALPPSDALLRKLRTLLATYREAGGMQPVLLFHDGEHGIETIDALARYGDGLPANVLPVQVNKSLVQNHAQPNERRGCGTVGIMLQALAGGQECLLQYVIRPQPPPQGFGQTEVNHPPQPLALAREQLGQGLGVTAPQAAFKIVHPDAGIVGHVTCLWRSKRIRRVTFYARRRNIQPFVVSNLHGVL